MVFTIGWPRNSSFFDVKFCPKSQGNTHSEGFKMRLGRLKTAEKNADF